MEPLPNTVKPVQCKAKRYRVDRTPIRYEMKTASCKQGVNKRNFHIGLPYLIRYEMKTVSCKRGQRLRSHSNLIPLKYALFHFLKLIFDARKYGMHHNDAKTPGHTVLFPSFAKLSALWLIFWRESNRHVITFVSHDWLICLNKTVI